jgi:hypothetical protein
MTGTLLPRMFTLEIDGRPTFVFGAKNLREAHELCREGGCAPIFCPYRPEQVVATLRELTAAA